ncbi:SMI1/KNR4 family protein [Massilia aquatica]|uniref:SMI1/KNR4 family protein n=1 Tax=Massilia aquatica TaxID=2609000 RepID=A0ABX0MB48_9BURK|nr:SMI1/KNR4 family protein [Massilia aquatica]NHZ44398.1 SMI1/KNR4 family protein [Massilia aquatica]
MSAKSTPESTAWELLHAANKQQQEHHFEQALALAGTARAALNRITAGEAKVAHYPVWGKLFEVELAALEALGRPADMIAVATELTDKFRLSDDTLFGNDLVSFREVLRQAHGILALDCLARQDTTHAIALIEAAFKIKAGLGEYLDPFEALYDIRAQVYCQAADTDPETYRERLFSALNTLQKKEVEHYRTVASARPKALFADPDFLAYQQNTPLQKLMRRNAGDTWKDAIKRFADVAELLGFDDYQASFNELTVSPPETEAALSQLELQLACTIPAALRQLYLEHGALQMREDGMWGTLAVYGSEHEPRTPPLSGLMDGIDSLWGGRPEFDDSFSEEELGYLNAHYVVFGHIHHDDNSYTHLYFNKNGGCGALYYHQDDWDDAYSSFEDMLTPPHAGGASFDSLFSNAVDEVIESMVSWKEDEDNEA